jgi:putative transposase
MPRWHNHYLDNHAHFCTATVARWRPVLKGQAVDILYGEWEAARDLLSVKILSYVVMPSHFHSVLWAERGAQVRNFLQRVLALTSHRLQPGAGFWKERPRVVPVYSRAVLRTKVEYLHRNPVREGLVRNPDEWEHSSYRQIALGCTDIRFVCDGWDGILA